MKTVTAESSAKSPPELIKVGYTSLDFEERRRKLNTGNPYLLQYVATWKVTDGPKGERVAHNTLADLNLRAQPYYGGGREWFRLPKGRYVGAQKLIEGALKDLQMLASSENWVSPMISNMDYKRRPTHK